MTSELEPCPFCGCVSVAVSRIPYTGGDVWGYVAECDRCWAKSGYYDNKAEAIDAWNTRAERTCEVVGVYVYGERDELRAYALSCGHEFGWDDEEPPAYCPECGAKVVNK